MPSHQGGGHNQSVPFFFGQRTNNAGDIWVGNLFGIMAKTQDIQFNTNHKKTGGEMILTDIQKIKDQQFHSFAEFARDKLPMPGDKKHLNEILNREILVLDFRITDSKKRQDGKCLQLQFLMDDNVYVAFTGSGVLINQMQNAREKLPFRATVVKIDKYYSFS